MPRSPIRHAKRKTANPNSNGPKTYQNAAIVAYLPAAIAKVSGGGRYRYSLRRLYYAVRPHIKAVLGVEISWKYFCGVITDHEAGLGHDLPGIYRDDRGTLYHPHTGELIPLGTRSVEAYRRRKWTFNKVLYVEKEG
jgi:hypothetical protein